MRFRAMLLHRAKSAIVAAILLLCPLSLRAQRTVDIRERLCGNCSVRLTLQARLGTADGPGILGSQPIIDVAPDAHFFVSDASVDASNVVVFDRSGRYVRNFGRRGRGPGEFHRVSAVYFPTQDTIRIYDSVLGRVTTFVSSRVTRTDPIAVRFRDYVMLDNGAMIVNGSLSTSDQIGIPLHILDAHARVTRSFGGSEELITPGRSYVMRRVLAAAGQGRFWAAPIDQFQIQLWHSDGRQLGRYNRNVSWYPRWRDVGAAPSNAPPQPQVIGLFQDNRRLWVVIQVADAKYKAEPRPSTVMSFVDEARFFDTIIEVWDLDTESVIVHQRLDERLLFIRNTHLVFAAKEDRTGAPFYEIYRLTVLGLER